MLPLIYPRHSITLLPPIKRCSLLKLYAALTNAHSVFTFSIPRSINCRNPITRFIIPNTGSPVSFRFLNFSFPLFVFSFLPIYSFALMFAGGRPLGVCRTLPFSIKKMRKNTVFEHFLHCKLHKEPINRKILRLFAAKFYKSDRLLGPLSFKSSTVFP